MNERLGQKRNENGFTLFELLIVIVILAILAGIVAYSVGTSTASAATSSCQTDAKTFGAALEQYKAQVGSYPPIGPLPPASYPYLTTPQIGFGETVGPFLRELPDTTHYRIATDSQGGVFVYPANAPINHSQSGMDNQTVSGVGGPASDGATLNFETNPGICSDPNVVT